MHTSLQPVLSGLGACWVPETSFLGKMFCGAFAADVYEEHQYGKIPPAISAEPPAPPPMTPSGSAVYTGQNVAVDLAKSSLDRTKEAYDRYIDAEIAAGRYHPEGQLPLTAEEAEKLLKSSMPWLLIGGGVLLLVLLARR